MFNKINIANWHRKDLYNRFVDKTPCSFNMCVNLDITNILCVIKDNKLKTFPVFLYAISKFVNKYNEFKMDYDESNCLGYYDIINPSFSVFDEAIETFSNIVIDYDNDFAVFYDNYINKINNIKRTCFNVSNIPWVSFSGFNLNLANGDSYLLPIFTIGKYYKENEKVLLPLSIQVNHAVCDAFHVARIINDIQKELDVFDDIHHYILQK